MTTSTYKDLIVWQRAMDLVIEIYKISKIFPDEERYGLTSQMRRAAISIPSNIAEGRRRGTRKDYRQFLFIAYGSGAEMETQLEIACRLNYLSPPDYQNVMQQLTEIMKMLNSMISSLAIRQ